MSSSCYDHLSFKQCILFSFFTLINWWKQNIEDVGGCSSYWTGLLEIHFEIGAGEKRYRWEKCISRKDKRREHTGVQALVDENSVM